MTREEAIDIIKCLAWHTRPNEEDIEQAIKALKQEPKWIPVSERLPQINEWVLCQCRAGYKVLRLTSYGCYCNDTQEYMDSFVIAWMPLPKPYEPQESEVNNG